jgi:hypothetical protein
MVVQRHLRSKAERIEEFGNKAEKPTTKELAIRNAIKDEPAWKRRNREPKTTGTQFRFSESQLKLLQMAKADQEKSIQKILEAIVWPVLEEQYGTTEGQAPS